MYLVNIDQETIHFDTRPTKKQLAKFFQKRGKPRFSQLISQLSDAEFEKCFISTSKNKNSKLNSDNSADNSCLSLEIIEY